MRRVSSSVPASDGVAAFAIALRCRYSGAVLLQAVRRRNPRRNDHARAFGGRALIMRMWFARASASRVRLGLFLAVAGLTMVASGSSTIAGAASPTTKQVYFWDGVAFAIRAPGQPSQPEVIRPSLINLFADGSWVIEHLHWTAWGSSVAHAKGISSASNGIPSEETGKRTLTPGQITLSNRGLFYGREVYRCFKLTVPPPATDLHGCLVDSGGYWLFLS